MREKERESSWSWRAQPSGMCLAVGRSGERAVRSLEPVPSYRGQRQEENREIKMGPRGTAVDWILSPGAHVH